MQRKSGRLQVEYPDAPGAFFFEDGQLIDAQLGSLRGLEAFYAAIELRGASFNFNPLVRPPERSIDRQQQKFISDMVEVPRRENLAEIKLAGGGGHAAGAMAASLVPTSQPAPLQLAPLPVELIAPLEVRLTAVEEAINATSRRFSRERLIYAVVISFLVGLTAVTALQALFNLRKTSALLETGATPASRKPDAASGMNVAAAGGEAARVASAVPVKKDGEGIAPVGGREGVAATSQAAGATKNGGAAATISQTSALKPTQTAAGGARKTSAAAAAAARDGYVVRVLMEVKDGKVREARVLNSRPGAAAYEALALKTARQRRYPKNFTGGDTWNIRVKP